MKVNFENSWAPHPGIEPRAFSTALDNSTACWTAVSKMDAMIERTFRYTILVHLGSSESDCGRNRTTDPVIGSLYSVGPVSLVVQCCAASRWVLSSILLVDRIGKKT